MSLSVSKIINLPQAALKFLVQDEIEEEPRKEYRTNGGVLSNTDYAWLSSGPRLEVVHNKTGNKMGAWTFGWVLKDLNTEVICIDEIPRLHGRLPLLAVGVDCDFNGGMVCIFDFVTSKVIRAINIGGKITSLHVIDAGYDIFTLPSPLRNFDGIISVGTAGGEVYLIDICRQICDEAVTTSGLLEIRDELNPCQLHLITSEELQQIEIQKEFAGHHLAIHLNVVHDKLTKHFILKGPKGDDRIHVNTEEVAVSALYYCSQLGSLLVGYNFGALQLFNLMNLSLVYTSPVCEDHIPISHFAVQEPADDPRAFCYIWAVYSSGEDFQACLPLAVMYAFSYNTKEYHEGYGFLYQDFKSAAVHYQMELAVPEGSKRLSKPRGGHCLRLTAINKGVVNREPHNDSSEDNLTLCIFVWCIWFKDNESDTFAIMFDLNQWYKEQMPNAPSSQYSSIFMHQICLSDLLFSATDKNLPVLDVVTNKHSLLQFTGTQRLEEHFRPNSISFDMCCLRESDLILLHHYGIQKALLAQIESAGALCLIEPADIYQEIVGLGLVPLFIDLPVNSPVSTIQQREVILGTALEHHLMGWLCKCASEWANGSFLAAGCSLDLLISWAFQRAATLKTNCDKFCVPLFDHSELRLDTNTCLLLNNCTRQLRNICSFYGYITGKLAAFISNPELVHEQYRSLQMISVYFEVTQWLLNVGLLPECPLNSYQYPQTDDRDRINAPYPAEMLIDFYNKRRAMLKTENENDFSSSSLLFIDNLIDRECGGPALQEQWRQDGGSGLYPPPSLQALLRTYLIDSVQLSNKNCVTIYVFLDLAMTLDQQRYQPVITHLIKFPAVFKVSPSVIKVTQAFWQLDHGDYNTAMGLLLDPLVLAEDLKSWHHKIVLRSLLLQKQHNFALLYIQVRKPALQDDEDVFTAISLLIANNMLDEAFYLRNNFSNQNHEQKLLMHIFNECTKGDKLSPIIYRSLSPEDERFFLKYLLNDKQAVSDDLHVYYHVLRSHFMEAFESHGRTIPVHLKNQGLVGQENAVPRDKLVYCLKKLLPEISKNLLTMCHRERNIWQKVERPTPMSVFVHNMTENVQYKSTLLAAALAKARQTFNDTVSEGHKIGTEETPFLRTPTVTRSSVRFSAVYVDAKVSLDEDTLSPTPAKRLKLSARQAKTPLSASVLSSKLLTPIVKRRAPKSPTSFQGSFNATTTPHSILKTRNLDNTQTDAIDKTNFYTPVLDRKSSLGLSPRKSLAKSPGVRFEGLKNLSSDDNNSSRELSLNNKVITSDSVSVPNSETSKNTSEEDDVFYSPDNSFEHATLEEVTKKKDVEPTSTTLPLSLSTPIQSPRARRGLKRPISETTPVRSSPRLANKTNSSLAESSESLTKEQLDQDVVKESQSIPSVEESVNSPQPDESLSSPTEISDSPKVLPKLRARKSLCRQVLETNIFNRVLNTPPQSPIQRPKRIIEEKTESVSEIENLHLESSFKYDDGEELHKSDSMMKHSLTTTSILESDLDSSSDDKVENRSVGLPKLSVSMVRYINRRSSFTGAEIDDDDKEESTNESDVFQDHSVNTSVSIDTAAAESDLPRAVEFPKLSVSMANYINRRSSFTGAEVDDDDKEESANEFEVFQDNSVTASVSIDPAAAESDLSRAVEFPKLSVSMANYINRRSSFTGAEIDDDDTEKSANEFVGVFQDKSVTTSVNVNVTTAESDLSVDLTKQLPVISDSIMNYNNDHQSRAETTVASQDDDDDDDDVMEVDNIIEINDEKEPELEQPTERRKNEEKRVYEEITNSSVIESRVEENNAGKDTGEVYYEDISNNRPVDPEMNVFEVTDDLSVNNSMMVQQEMSLEEKDLCYDQQNTLELVMEENISAVSSTPLDAFEKNVFNECSSSSDDEVELEQQEEILTGKTDPDAEEDLEDNKQAGSDKSIKEAENEVIEINSSSDALSETTGSESSDSDNRDSSGSTISSDTQSDFNVAVERNIYDSVADYFSGNSDVEDPRYSPISDDVAHEETEDPFALFHGEVLLEEEPEEQHGANIMIEAGKEKLEDTHSEDGKLDCQEEITANTNNSAETKENDDKEVETKLHDGEEEGFSLVYEVPDEDSNLTENIMESLPEPLEEQTKIQDAEQTVKEKTKNSEREQRKELDSEPQLQGKHSEISHHEKGQPIEESEVKIPEQKDEIQVTQVETNTFSATKQKGTKTNTDEEENARVVNADLLLVELKIGPVDGMVTEDKTLEQEDFPITNAPKTPTRRLRSQSTSENLTPRRSARRVSIDEKQDLSNNPSKVVGIDIIDRITLTPDSSRVLRSRRISTEEVRASVPATRKRSASVEEPTIPSKKRSTAKTVEVVTSKSRSQRAASVSHLPQITEETNNVDNDGNKRARSAVEGYTMNRRVTRRQVTLLKQSFSEAKSEGSNVDLDSLDPIILLDKPHFDGTADPEEKNVYKTSPSTTNSSTSSPKKVSRRLRSASQVSERSRRSESREVEEVVKPSKRSTRKTSADSVSSVSVPSTKSGTIRRQSKKVVDDVDKSGIATVSRTRSRAKSVSSAASDQSDTSATGRVTRSRQAIVLLTTLPEIQEEPIEAEKKVSAPTKRTRKNSSSQK